ncbi:MAG: HAD family hydrolase [Aquamicrobium sp.]|uniref:HAD family hydrolase n=1 Tax=Aquamicrobium sp. TaxID=1872579 RepID=UPI00349EF73D|nr:HAD family hydrolase [Aquamicrobium sp.]
MTDIRGILFDKDGTLIDFNATWFAAADAMALVAAAGERALADELLDVAGYDFSIRRFRPDSVLAAGTNADLMALWYPRHAEAERRALLDEFDRMTASGGLAEPVALPGCQVALSALHSAGYRLGVATNDSTGGAERTLLSLGVAQMFEAAYGYDAVANPKPAPDTIHAFCDLTGLKPAQLAMVGDNRHDLEMARAGGAGLAVAVLSGTGTLESLAPLADVVLDSIVDLPAYLARESAA